MKKEKVIAIIAGVFVCFLVFAGIVGSLQKPEFVILQSVEISKPAAEIFPRINDLKNWRQWNPWYSQDAQAMLEYSAERTAGPNAWVTWTSPAEAGAGKVEILDVVRDDAFKMRLQHFGFQDIDAQVFFKLKPINETTTQVLWRLEGKNDGFIDRVKSGFLSTISNLEKQMQKGLQNLKTVSEK